MASFTTAITEFSDNGNSRTYTYTGHTASEPRLVIQSRKVAVGASSNAEDVLRVISSTEDAAGALLSNRISFEAKCKRPVNGIAADVTAALAVFRDFVSSDEFTAMVTSQNFVQ